MKVVFVFDGVTRMSKKDIDENRAKVAKMMESNAQKPAPAAAPAAGTPAGGSTGPSSRRTCCSASIGPRFYSRRIPYLLGGSPGTFTQSDCSQTGPCFSRPMLGFAQAVMAGKDAGEIENKAFDLQDAILDAKI